MPPRKKAAAVEATAAPEEDVSMAGVPADVEAEKVEAEDADPAILANDEQRISIVG